MDVLITKEKKHECFNIKTYFLYLILPKLSLVWGEAITTSYLQIASNINCSPTKMQQFKDHCWMHTRTMAKKNGYNERTVKKVLKVLEELKIIRIGNVGKIKTYQLRNHDIDEELDVWSFVHYIENKLLSILTESDEKTNREKFKEINNYFLSKKINPIQSILVGKQENIRQNLVKVESIYKGSSLFYINLIVEKKIFKKTTTLSEHERSLLLGSSQSTLNRYIKSYEESNIIFREQKSKRLSVNLIKQ